MMIKQQVSSKFYILGSSKPKLPSMKNPYSSEEELLDAYLHREHAAQHVIYKEAWPFARKYVVLNSGSEDDAKDILQEAVLLFYQHLKSARYQKTRKASYTTYLNQISINLWKYELRKRKSRRNVISTSSSDKDESSTEIPDNSYSKENPTEKKWTEEESEMQTKDKNIQILKNAMDKLDEKCKAVIKMGYYEKRSHKDIAELLGFTEGFAKKKRHTCLGKLISIYKTLKAGEND